MKSIIEGTIKIAFVIPSELNGRGKTNVTSTPIIYCKKTIKIVGTIYDFYEQDPLKLHDTLE